MSDTLTFGAIEELHDALSVEHPDDPPWSADDVRQLLSNNTDAVSSNDLKSLLDSWGVLLDAYEDATHEGQEEFFEGYMLALEHATADVDRLID